jgi:hypothetical protein
MTASVGSHNSTHTQEAVRCLLLPRPWAAKIIAGGTCELRRRCCSLCNESRATHSHCLPSVISVLNFLRPYGFNVTPRRCSWPPRRLHATIFFRWGSLPLRLDSHSRGFLFFPRERAGRGVAPCPIRAFRGPPENCFYPEVLVLARKHPFALVSSRAVASRPQLLIPYPHRVVKKNVTHLKRKTGSGKPHQKGCRAAGSGAARIGRRCGVRGRAATPLGRARGDQQPDGRADGGSHPQPHAAQIEIFRRSCRRCDSNRTHLPEMSGIANTGPRVSAL